MNAYTSPQNERIRFYSESPPTTQFKKYKLNYEQKNKSPNSPLDFVQQIAWRAIHLSRTLLASVDGIGTKRQKSMGDTCHPPRKGM